MEVHEIFAKLKSHALTGMVFHDEMTRYYKFLNLDDLAKEHKERYDEETTGYRELCGYYLSHYNKLIPEEPMERINIIPENWYRYSRKDVDQNTKSNSEKVGIKKWVEWETETKRLYQDMFIELMDIGEVAAALFLSGFIKDVDNELKCAEKWYL